MLYYCLTFLFLKVKGPTINLSKRDDKLLLVLKEELSGGQKLRRTITVELPGRQKLHRTITAVLPG